MLALVRAKGFRDGALGLALLIAAAALVAAPQEAAAGAKDGLEPCFNVTVAPNRALGSPPVRSCKTVPST